MADRFYRDIARRLLPGWLAVRQELGEDDTQGSAYFIGSAIARKLRGEPGEKLTGEGEEQVGPGVKERGDSSHM